MKKWTDISRVWISQILSMVLIGYAFPFVWAFILNSDGDAEEYRLICYVMIMILFGVMLPYTQMKGILGTIISLGGKRKDAFVGSNIAQFIYILLAELGAMVVYYIDKANIDFGFCITFLGILLLVGGLGNLLYVIEKRFSNGVFIVAAILIFLGAAMSWVVVLSMQRYEGIFQEESSRGVVYGALALGIVIMAIGKYFQYRMIQKYEVSL